jgi:type IX secretion system PorP/SprF family membrane protein
LNSRDKYWLVLFFLLLGSGDLYAQDAGFSQFYANPLYLNPAFAGTLDVPRINFHYRNQWQNFPTAFTTYSASFDFPVKKLRGGLGFNFLNDKIAGGLLNSFQADVIYTSFIKLNQYYTLSGSIEAGFHQNSLDWNGLVFPDNLDPYYGQHGITKETPITDPRYQYIDFATGVLIYGQRMFAGLAVHHLTRPAQSYYQGQEEGDVLNRKYSLHFGIRVPVYIFGHWRKKFDISPQIVAMQQGRFTQFNYGLLANLKGFTVGSWFRQDLTFNYDSFIFLVGYMRKRWHFTYSYDWTVSGLSGKSGGTSEFSVGFLLKDLTTVTAFPFYRPYED